MVEISQSKVFYLPPGTDFADELVAGLRERMAGKPTEAMARVRLFLNSQRMRRRVSEAFAASGPGFLPQMQVVSELRDDPVLAGLPRGMSDFRRQLELAKLVRSLLRAQPDLAPQTSVFDLAESLAKLLDEMQGEDVPPAAIAALDVSQHSEHWARTQAFLRIVAPIFADRNDPQARQREAVRRLAAEWAVAPPEEPVIVAGSTGSRGTTGLLMRVVAALPNGMVVVPGFDTDLPGAVWEGLSDVMTGEDHPQFRYRKLMDALGLNPTDFALWRQVRPYSADRNRVISLALRPAPVTDQWLIEGQHLPDLPVAMRDVTLVEAANPREEALAIALTIREAVEQGARIALISPDRGLTRRVAAALDRWGIVADDTAGTPLALSAPGRFLRHVAEAFGRPLASDHLLTLLKHPVTHSGEGRMAHLRHTRQLERELRRNGPAFPTGAALLLWAQRQGEAGVLAWAEWLAPLLEAMGPKAPDHLTGFVAAHLGLAEALARGLVAEGQLWAGVAGAEARRLMDKMQAEAPHGESVSAADYIALFSALIAKGEVREAFDRHPLVGFYGHREAREMRADIAVVGGLSEGVWPAASDPDPWLNRRMRKDVGLLLPERQIGLAAHDFQQAAAARQVILTRSLRDAEAEAVPSRWLNRLNNLMAGLPDRHGPEALEEMRARGLVWLEQARALEEPTAAHRDDPRLHPAPRPKVQPPVAVRPKSLSLTRIGTLIRDPYAIYARYILNLRVMDPLRHKPDMRERGTLIHEILEAFVKTRPEDESRSEAKARLMQLTEAILQESTPFPSARVLWRARLEKAAEHLLQQDSKYGGVPVQVEARGEVVLPGGGFTLFGTPDRIDILPDGRLHLIDYKTGTPPTTKQQAQYEKQLLLAACMAERGGFGGLDRTEVARISYIGLGSGEKVEDTEVTETLLEEQWSRFCTLIVNFARRDTGYIARRAVFEAQREGDYDHLARFGEWQMSDGSKALRVGGDDDAE